MNQEDVKDFVESCLLCDPCDDKSFDKDEFFGHLTQVHIRDRLLKGVTKSNIVR